MASKVIPFSALSRQQRLHYLKHQAKEFREREDYLVRLRKLLFQIEAQMRQTEMQQLEGYRDIAAHFKVPLTFPDLGDRVGLQEFFASHPLLVALREFFAGRLAPEECLEQIMALRAKPEPSPD